MHSPFWHIREAWWWYAATACGRLDILLHRFREVVQGWQLAAIDRAIEVMGLSTAEAVTPEPAPSELPDPAGTVTDHVPEAPEGMPEALQEPVLPPMTTPSTRSGVLH